MNALYYVAATGQIRRTCTGLLEEEALGLLEGDEKLILTEEPGILSWTHYVDIDTKEIVAYTEQQLTNFQAPPRPGYEWSVRQGEWRDARSVSQIIEDRCRELKTKRDQVLNTSFTWDGSVFDSDAISQARIHGLYTSSLNSPESFPIAWRLVDNSWRTLSVADASALWSALQQHVQYCFQNYAIYEAAIQAMDSRKAVLAYSIESGWPS